jgi:hypothetical protein
MNGMGKSLGIHRNMAFDARYLLAAIISFFFSRICILHTLGINDDKTGFLLPTIVDTNHANQFFLSTAEGDCHRHLRVSHSIC